MHSIKWGPSCRAVKTHQLEMRKNVRGKANVPFPGSWRPLDGAALPSVSQGPWGMQGPGSQAQGLRVPTTGSRETEAEVPLPRP